MDLLQNYPRYIYGGDKEMNEFISSPWKPVSRRFGRHRKEASLHLDVWEVYREDTAS